jgi:hypothetical protein
MPNITFYAPQFLHEQLQQRGLGRGENTIRRDLERYYTLIDIATQRVQQMLSQNELDLLRDALNGTEVQPELVRYLPQALVDAVGDARHDGLCEKWGVDAHALAEKLSKLSLLEAVALVDSIERFWESQRE